MRRTILLAPLLLAGCMTFDVQETHFFQAGPAEHPTPIAAPGVTVEPLTLTTSDGVALAGARASTTVADVEILYFGGNVSRIDDYGAAFAQQLAPLRANLTFFDYRGYGRSGGTPQIETLKSDAVAIFDSVAARSHLPIIVHGFSLGSFIAAHVASARPVAGLVLESTAPDVQSWATNQIPFYAKPFVRVKIAPALLQQSTERVVRGHRGPLMLITGADDPVTPPKFAQALAAVSPSANKRVTIMPQATHGTAMESPIAMREYAAFLDSIRAR